MSQGWAHLGAVGGAFSSPVHALISSLNYGLYSEFDDFDSDFASRASGWPPSLHWPAVLVFNLMMVLVQIVLLNLLIAVMTDSYDKVREAGLEPATSRLSAGCSNRLSYPRKGKLAD